MSALFVINPAAGRGRALRVWRQLQGSVARRPRAEAVIPADGTQTRRMAAEAVKAGIKRVIVVGGDGTLHAVADELALSDTALGVVPAGTGNDFCRHWGIPCSAAEALEIALGGRCRRIDLGRVSGGRHFLNVAGFGFDAEVALAATRFPRGIGGTLPYLLAAFATLAWYRPVKAEIMVDDRIISGRFMLAVVANGRFYGGGMQIAPEARCDDGLLDICLAGSLERLELIRLIKNVYSARHIGHPKVQMLRGRHIRIMAAQPAMFHLDGEALGAERLEFEAVPRALAMVMPPTRFGTPESILWWDS